MNGGRGRVRRSSVNVAVAIGALLGAVALGGCGTAAPPAPSGASQPTAVASGTAQPAASTATAADRTVRVSYAAGQVSGDVGKVAVRVGSVVDLVVTSDVADEVHLHGYDKSVDVAAGGTATLRFTADIPGGFEVELERLSKHLVELQVS